MLKAVIFDMDGTLGDTVDLCVESFRQTVEELTGRCPSAEEVLSHFGVSDRGVLGALLGLDPEDPSLPVQHLVRVYERLHPQYAPAPFAGAVEMLQRLPQLGLRVALITGKEAYTAYPSLIAFGFAGLFEWEGLGVPSHNCKAERLQELMKLWKLSPEEMIYVGDAPSDIELCHSVSVPIISAAWAASAPRDAEACLALKPEYRLDDFNRLESLLKTLAQ